MKRTEFKFADGSRFQPGAIKDADLVGKRIDAIGRKNKGEILPEHVVDDARSTRSPLHSFFEWDDGVAAEEHRLAQARKLIRSVVAVYISADTEPVKMRSYVNISDGGTSSYREIVSAMSNKKTREIVIKKALSELKSWREKYHDLKEFAEVFVATDNVEMKIAA